MRGSAPRDGTRGQHEPPYARNARRQAARCGADGRYLLGNCSGMRSGRIGGGLRRFLSCEGANLYPWADAAATQSSYDA
jgi:hypothetical protein